MRFITRRTKGIRLLCFLPAGRKSSCGHAVQANVPCMSLCHFQLFQSIHSKRPFYQNARCSSICAVEAYLYITLHCRRIAPMLFSRRENNRAGIARPLALPLGELARLKAVTERAPSSNPPPFSIFATAQTLSVSPLARQLSQRESQGRLRRRICTGLPSALPGQPPPADKPGCRPYGLRSN